jgi:hypothetical protein
MALVLGLRFASRLAGHVPSSATVTRSRRFGAGRLQGRRAEQTQGGSNSPAARTARTVLPHAWPVSCRLVPHCQRRGGHRLASSRLR